MESINKPLEGLSRRNFIKTSAIAAAGVSAGFMRSGNFAFAAGSEKIRVGVSGCGGRGTGAVRDIIAADPNTVLVSMGDLFQDRLDESKDRLKEAIGDRFEVKEENQFVGFDAYQQVLDSGIDIIILAEPPGYRPKHFEAAVEKGVHVFMEKPVAVDSAGIRAVMAASDVAREKGLAVVAGTQRRHDLAYREAMNRIHDGMIGEVVSAQVYWNQAGLWLRERKPGMSDAEWQCRNWYYFTWLSGDHIVEQHIHQHDVANWAFQGHPVKAVGVGGRQVRVDPSYGHIFDHFAIDYEYENGGRVLSMCRQMDGTATNVSEHIIGTRGSSNANTWIRGEQTWRFEGDRPNPYEQEHVHLIESIRSGEPINEGRQVAESTLTAIMGREAAYTGQEITWDEILNADLDLMPKSLSFGPMPFPDVAVPGVTTIQRSAIAQATSG